MQWNEIDYEMQMKILDRIGDLILQEKDEAMQFGIAAAITELEVWSNSPINDRPQLPKKTPWSPRPVSKEFLKDLKSAEMREEVTRTNEKGMDTYEATAQDELPPEEDWK